MSVFAPPLPAGARPFAEYVGLDAETIRRRTWAAKRALGKRVVILGHHYQRESVIEFADVRGDSFKLAQLAAAQPDAEIIVFCGVHFMAESADVLRQPHQTVILPDLKAGCSMADMAVNEDVEEAWDRLVAVHGEQFTPVTYMNSTAALKAFCGERGGVVCTSSNASRVLAWAWKQRPRVFFFPDQHLGRNSAYAMGVPLGATAAWDFRAPDPGRVNAACVPPTRRGSCCGRGSARCTPSSRSTRSMRCAPRSGGEGARASRVPVRRGAERRSRRLDRIHHRAGGKPRPTGRTGRSAPRSTSSTGWRWSIRSSISSRCRKTFVRARP